MRARVFTGLLITGVIAFALFQRSPELDVPYTPRGPAVGQPLPSFSLPDQAGVMRDFSSLRGPSGLVLVFFQSADW